MERLNEMIRFFLLATLLTWTIETSAKTCHHIFELDTPKNPIKTMFISAYAKPADGITQDKLLVQIRPSRKAKSIDLIYGNYALLGYQTKTLRLESQAVDSQGSTISTYSFQNNGIKLITLTVTERLTNNNVTYFYQLVFKNQITTPSSSDRTFHLSSEDAI
jgi:hypothetical protein